MPRSWLRFAASATKNDGRKIAVFSRVIPLLKISPVENKISPVEKIISTGEISVSASPRWRQSVQVQP